jgi:hypothetical protein
MQEQKHEYRVGSQVRHLATETSIKNSLEVPPASASDYLIPLANQRVVVDVVSASFD